jgi:hypothetical protein
MRPFVGIRHQPPWLGRIDQISIKKILTDYSRSKLFPQATWIFFYIISGVIYEKLIKNSSIVLP